MEKSTSPLQRVVICLNKNTLSPNAVFGPFTSLTKSAEFVGQHKKVCKLVHIHRKLYHPKFGANNVY